jgi:hypothetical protein
MRTTVISAQNPGQADESLNLPALVEHILEGAKLRLASWKSLTIAEIDLSLDRSVPRSLESMPQAVSKKTSLSLKCAPPEAVDRFRNSPFDTPHKFARRHAI